MKRKLIIKMNSSEIYPVTKINYSWTPRPHSCHLSQKRLSLIRINENRAARRQRGTLQLL